MMFDPNTLVNNFFGLVKVNESTLPGARRGQTELFNNLLLGGMSCVCTVDAEKCYREGGYEQYVSTYCHELGHAAFWLLYPERQDATLMYQEGVADICAAYILAIKKIIWPKGLLIHYAKHSLDDVDLEEVSLCLKMTLGIDAPYQLSSIKRAFDKKAMEYAADELAALLGL